MNAKEAVAARILALCAERGIAINALAGSAGVSPSTVYSMLNAKSQNPGVVSLQKLCDGLGITLRQFFDDDLFDNIEQEIKYTTGAPVSTSGAPVLYLIDSLGELPPKLGLCPYSGK